MDFRGISHEEAPRTAYRLWAIPGAMAGLPHAFLNATKEDEKERKKERARVANSEAVSRPPKGMFV